MKIVLSFDTPDTAHFVNIDRLIARITDYAVTALIEEKNEIMQSVVAHQRVDLVKAYDSAIDSIETRNWSHVK